MRYPKCWISLIVAWRELKHIEETWAAQHKPYSSIIQLVQGFCLGFTGAILGMLVGFGILCICM